MARKKAKWMVRMAHPEVQGGIKKVIRGLHINNIYIILVSTPKPPAPLYPSPARRVRAWR